MNDVKSLMDMLSDIEESSELMEASDTFTFELGEDGDEWLVETGVVACDDESVIVEADEETLSILSENFILEDFEELTESEIIKYNNVIEENEEEVTEEVTEEVNEEETDEAFDQLLKYSGLNKPAKDRPQKDRTDYDSPAFLRKADQSGKKLSPELDQLTSHMYNDDIREDMARLADIAKMPELNSDPELKKAVLAKLKATNEDKPHVQMRMGTGSDASSAGSFKMSENAQKKIPSAYDKSDTHGLYMNGRLLKAVHTREEAERLKKENSSYKNAEIKKIEDKMDEAKYHGRTVPLGKPMKGDVKKSKVYVRKPNGKIVKVNFGDKKMRIKKSNPKRRKSFRARHNCKNPGPRWKARYWSCRAW